MVVFYLFFICFLIYNWNYNPIGLKKSVRLFISDFIYLLGALKSYLNITILYLESGIDFYFEDAFKLHIDI